MNRYFSLIILSLIFNNTYSIGVKFDTKTPPLFAQLISESLKSEKINSAQIKKINKDLNSLSFESLSYLDKEIIKFTLSHTKKLTNGYQLIDQSMYARTESNLKKIPEKRPFSKLIYQALITDIGELLTDRELITYKNYLKTKTSKLDQQTSMFKNKMNLVTPWIRLLEQSTPEELDNKLDIFSNSTLNHTLKIIKLLKRSSRLNLANATSTLTNFIEVEDKGLDSARSLIKQLTFKVEPDTDPDYQAPAKLPKEVDHWVPIDETIIEDGAPLTKDQLFPEPEEDYTPPKILPKPIDSWQE